MTSPSPDNANDEQTALATILRATWFGASLDDPTIGRLSALARRRTAKAGEVLLVEGGRSDELGVVVPVGWRCACSFPSAAWSRS